MWPLSKLLRNSLHNSFSLSKELNLPVITSLAQDSRKVQKGSLFASLPSYPENNERRIGYIKEAIEKGACAILVSSHFLLPSFKKSVIFIYHDNVALAWSKIVSVWYQAQPNFNVAVTGTNGKTSTVHHCLYLWESLGKKASSMGTMGIKNFSKASDYYSGLNTLDALSLHRVLSELKKEKCNYLAMEASSHGLHQYRMDGVKLEAAGFTQFSQDHLDYHGTMECYFEAKKRLFTDILPKGKYAILNGDDPYFVELYRICKERGQHVIDYGRNAISLRIMNIEPQADGYNVEISIYRNPYTFYLPLTGEFQIYNLLCALGLIIATTNPLESIDFKRLLQKVALLPLVPGRLELVATHPSGALIYIDYAHKPEALKEALIALRPKTRGKLYVVFGCGGNRDQGKRALMGKNAAEKADIVIITDDNPRYEDPALIRQAILASCPGAIEIKSRGEAITYAISQLKAEDILLIAGKGHETTQIVKDQIYYFHDGEYVKKMIKFLE